MSAKNAEAEPAELAEHLRAEPSQLALAEHVERRFWHVPRAGRDPKDLLEPTYWSKLVHRLQFPDLIICVPADRSWIAKLRVLDSGPLGVHVHPEGGLPFPDVRGRLAQRGPADTEVADYHFVDTGPITGWSVVRLRDGHVMRDGLTMAQCSGWLTQHLKTMRR